MATTIHQLILSWRILRTRYVETSLIKILNGIKPKKDAQIEFYRDANIEFIRLTVGDGYYLLGGLDVKYHSTVWLNMHNVDKHLNEKDYLQEDLQITEVSNVFWKNFEKLMKAVLA